MKVYSNTYQRAAVAAYGSDPITAHKGDTLALFVFREMSDVESADEAVARMETAIEDLTRSRDALVRLAHDIGPP
jgi:hypothetical protein